MTAARLQVLRTARPLDPGEVLRRLAEHATALRGENPSRASRASSSEPSLPRVRIEAGAHAYAGSVVSVEPQPGGLYVLLARTDVSGESALAYLDLRAPFSVTLEDAAEVPHLLGDKESLRWSKDEPLGALETKRWLAERGTELGAMGLELDVAPDVIVAGASEENNQLRDLVQELARYLRALGEDDAGRDARSRLTKLELGRGKGPVTVKRDGGTLRVAFDSGRGLPTKTELCAALDAKL